MNKREFNKIINSLRTKDKKSLDYDKISVLSDSVKDSLVCFIVRNRGPVLEKLIPQSMNFSWLACMGYMYTTQSKTTGEQFVHTTEHRII